MSIYRGRKIRAVILTKSFMHGGFCVAGIDIDSSRWVRFVSDASGAPLFSRNLKFLNGRECEPLEVAEVTVCKYAPVRHHTENYVIDDSAWKRIGTATIGDVFRDCLPQENHKYIFGNIWSYLTEEQLNDIRLNYSLMLACVNNLNINYIVNAVNKVKAVAEFIYRGRQYKFIRVTDPDYVMSRQNVSINRACVVMSIARDAFNVNGSLNYYKFAAKIFPVQ